MRKNKINNVSIILPTYNRPELLKEAIDSILSQTFTHFEVILSNNCSTNPEVDVICKKYANKDSRIKYFKQNYNIGCLNNSAFCISKSTNEYVIGMSDDDILDPNFLNEVIKKINETPNAIGCFCKLKYIDENRNIIATDLDSNIDLSSINPINNIIKWTMLKHWGPINVFKKDIAHKCNINYKNTFAGDVLFGSQLLLYGTMPKIEEPLYTYQVRTKSQDIKLISEDNKDFNEYSLESVDLDIILKTFELIFETDKLSSINKLYFYIKMWFTIFTTKHWMEKLNNIATIKCIDLLFKNKAIVDIIYVLPYICYIKYKQLIFIIENLNFFVRKIKPNTVLIVNYDDSDGKTLLEYANYFLQKDQNVDILSSKSYKKNLSNRNIHIIKTKKYKRCLQFNKIRQYSSIIFTEQTDYVYLLGKNNKALSINQILKTKNEVHI